MEESLQARVTLEQILSLPELKVPAPDPPGGHAVPILVFPLFSPNFLGAKALPKSPTGII